MRRNPTIAAILLVCTTSCSTPQPVEIRAASSSPQVRGLGEAQGQLALGNVALALEGFRNVLRDNPGSVDAAVGIAHCYENMGRFDLSRRWFETALASAPENAAVLNDFASSLERQGKYVDAAAVRDETLKLVSAAVAEPLQASAFIPPAPADVGVETAPSLESSPTTPIVTLHLPPPAPVQKAEPLKLAPTKRTEVTLPAPGAQARVVLPAPINQAEALKPQRLVQALIAAEPRQTGPRLERLSLGEVALITRPTPTWTAKIVERTAQSVTFRWVPLRPVARLLNAARNEGLAARTRSRLAENGWRRIEIGNAPIVRAKTLVLYPEYRRHTAQKLAAQFGFTHLQSFNGSEIVVLLGRDAAALKALRPA